MAARGRPSRAPCSAIQTYSRVSGMGPNITKSKMRNGTLFVYAKRYWGPFMFHGVSCWGGGGRPSSIIRQRTLETVFCPSTKHFNIRFFAADPFRYLGVTVM